MLGVLTLEQGTFGFGYKKKNWTIPSACPESQVANNSLMKLIFYSATNSGDVLSFLHKCFPAISRELSGNISHKIAISAEIYDETHLAMRELFLLLKSPVQNLAVKSKLLEKFRNHPHNILAILGEIFIAISSDNHVWAGRKIEEMVEKNPERVLFELKSIFANADMNKNLVEAIAGTLKRLEHEEEIRTQFLLFCLFFEVGGESFLEKYESQLPNLQWIRKMSALQSKGKIYFWYYVLLMRSTLIEAQQYLEDNLEVLDSPDQVLWALSQLNPSGKSIKEESFKKIIKLFPVTDPYNKLLFLKLLEDGQQNKLFEHLDNWGRISYFQLQRKIYGEMLAIDFASAYAVHQLLLLNDSEISDERLKHAVIP